jgi:hypothetical protein
MSVENAGGTAAPNTQPGTGGTANAPAIDVAAISAQVAESLKASISAEITGAVKRQTASLAEQLAALKPQGNADAPKPGDDGKVNPERVKNTELNERLKAIEADAAKYKARAIRGAVSEAVASAKVTASARQLLIDTLSAQAREDDQGNLYIGQGEDAVPLSKHLAEYLKGKDDLLEASARPGSGAGMDAAGQFSAANMPKTKAELMWTAEKNPGGYQVVADTPNRVLDFIAQFGQAAFDALPMGAKPPGRPKLR